MLGLVNSIEGTNRNIAIDNYYTSMTLATKLKRRNLTLVRTMKKNKTSIPFSFLENQMRVQCITDLTKRII